MNIDPRTVILLAGVMGGIMSIVLYFMRRNFPPSIRGLGEWAAAPALIFVSLVLLAARGVIPQFFSVIVANMLLLSGLSLFHFGTQRFLGLPTSIRLWIGVVLLPMPILAWYTFVEPHYGMRVLLISFLMTVLTTSNALLLARHGARSFATYLCITALAVQSLAQMLRFVAGLSIPADSTLFILSPAQQIYATTYTFCILMLCVSAVLMATDKLRAEFEHHARHDSLTGALTRGALIEAGERELERNRRKNHVISLLMMDLDHFKAINDSHGHLAGDRVLVDFVARVTALLRRPDRFGRFGGEEFIALLPETSLEDARIVAERIRADIASAGVQPWCTVSIGVATSCADDATVDALLARADAALYQAKAAGRNCVRTAD